MIPVPNGALVEKTGWGTQALIRWMNAVTRSLGGGGSGPMFSQVCVGGETVITIPVVAGFTNLLLEFVGRDTYAGGFPTMELRMRMNGDATAANYQTSQYVQGSGATASAATVASSTAGMVIGFVPGVVNRANALAVVRAYIPAYSGTAFLKMVHSDYGEMDNSAPTRRVGRCLGEWESLAAITQLELTAPTTAFAAGSTVTVYGY